jgi:hypothetical protein
MFVGDFILEYFTKFGIIVCCLAVPDRFSGIEPAHAINIFPTEKLDDICDLETSRSCLVCNFFFNFA